MQDIVGIQCREYAVGYNVVIQRIGQRKVNSCADVAAQYGTTIYVMYIRLVCLFINQTRRAREGVTGVQVQVAL